VYYRLNLLPIESPKKMPDDGTLLLGKPVSIQIFDSLFNCIGETLLPINKVKIFDYFIASKGLYISNNHPDNPDFKEDSLNYTIYVPKIIK
jgi:hypothetical protein